MVSYGKSNQQVTRSDMEVYIFLWKSKVNWPVEHITGDSPFEYTRDDFTSGKINYVDIIHPDDKKKTRRTFNSYYKLGYKNISLQYRVITKSGDTRWVDEKVIIQKDTESSKQYLSIIVDITDQKRNEDHLQETLAIKDELESIINNSPVVVFQWKSEGKLEEKWPVEFISDNITRFGYTPDEFYSGRLQYGDIIHPADLEHVQYELCRRRVNGYDNFSQEYRIITNTGKIRWVDERTFIQRDKNGKALSYQGIIVDITERKHTMNLLHTQHDIALLLNTRDNPEEVFDQVLELILNIDTVDCGCIYLTDEKGDLNLITSMGLSTEFVNNVSYLDSTSILNRIIITGQPVYKDYSEIPFKADISMGKNEKLRAVALIPIVCDGVVLGALNLSSHICDEIPIDVRTAIETIAAQLGGFIIRMNTEMNLYEYQTLGLSNAQIDLEFPDNS